MAELTHTPATPVRRPGVRRMKKHDLKTDMTPMVDLGFLLIAFFVITTELSKPAVTKLNMPHPGTGTEVGDSYALTILLDEANAVQYYHGNWQKALAENRIIKTSFTSKDGLGDVIREKQLSLDRDQVKHPGSEGRKGLMLLIKASENANYENVIDVLDEILINDVKKYAMVKLEVEERNYLDEARRN